MTHHDAPDTPTLQALALLDEAARADEARTHALLAGAAALLADATGPAEQARQLLTLAQDAQDARALVAGARALLASLRPSKPPLRLVSGGQGA